MKRAHGVHLKCEKCDKTFLFKKSLNDHLKLVHEIIVEVHNDNKVHNCEKCGKIFKQRKHLTNHIRCDA